MFCDSVTSTCPELVRLIQLFLAVPKSNLMFETGGVQKRSDSTGLEKGWANTGFGTQFFYTSALFYSIGIHVSV